VSDKNIDDQQASLQTGSRVQALVQFAYETARSGRVTEAMKIWQQILSIAPKNPQALFHLGAYALHKKEPVRAQKFFASALDADPSAAPIALNLAYAYRDMGDAQNEMEAIQRALAIDPHFYPALLAKGAALERTGLKRQAAKIYAQALSEIPHEDDIAPDLREIANHARLAVRDNAGTLKAHIDDRLSAAMLGHRGESLERFKECKAIALGEHQVYTQKAAMLLIPWLPPIQFYNNGDFPWIKDIEKMTNGIHEELNKVVAYDKAGFKPYVERPSDEVMDNWRDLNRSPRWSAYFFWKDGRRFDEACDQCPQTVSVKNIAPSMDARNFGPTLMYSVLAPRTHLPAHSSATNARLIVHLPLVVPEKCRFRVGNETREWQEGRAWVFDDTINHEAWNDSDEFRTILLFDIWNPYLTETERELVPILLNTLNEYYSVI
jgi:aspartyl/asparaginyl beta-hydroxylase (cupin superfamily)